MCGYSYAITAIMTHYFQGPQDTCMRDHNSADIYEATKDTLQMVRQDMETEDIYPENPNLVLSTDDTTLFVFDG